MSKDGAVKGFGIFFIVWSSLTLIGAVFGAITFGAVMAFGGMSEMSGGNSAVWLMLGSGLVDIIGGCWLMYAGTLVRKQKKGAPAEVTIASGIYIISNLFRPISGMSGYGAMMTGGFLSLGLLGMAGNAVGIAFWGFVMWYFNQPDVKKHLNR
jgi:hypothetical protein